MKNILKILIIFAAVLFFGWTGSAEAATCNQANLFIITNSSIGWGDTPNDLRWSAVSAIPGTSVRLSLAGEDGCAGRTANFEILNSAGGTVGKFDGVLKLGKKITGEKYQLYYDWNNNLPAGNGYKFKVRSLPLVALSLQSVNVLNVEQINQACRLSNVVVVSPTPGGTTFGTPVGIRVSGQGCQGWGASMNIYRYFTTGSARGTRQFLTTLSEQKFPAGNQLTFSWNPEENPGTGSTFSYQAEAVAGVHKLDSNVFVVSGTGGYGATTKLPVEKLPEVKTTTSEKKVSLNFSNLLRAENLNELIVVIMHWLRIIVLPIVVIVIVISGIMMMSAGKDLAKFTQGKKMLTWAVVGLVVILIGEGFTKLIESIIELKNR